LDLSSPFRSEVFRPITGLLIPGLVACLPWTLLAAHYFPAIEDYRDKHELVYLTIVGLIVIGIGFVLEDLGTELELLIDSRLIDGKHPDLYAVWYEYLALKFDIEPVGQRYLRTVLLRLKFELATAVAVIICYGGLVWLCIAKGLLSWVPLALLGLGFTALAIFLGHQAYKGAEVLANVRRVLVGKAPVG
jgi:hypothetical protein